MQSTRLNREYLLFIGQFVHHGVDPRKRNRFAVDEKGRQEHQSRDGEDRLNADDHLAGQAELLDDDPPEDGSHHTGGKQNQTWAVEVVFCY